MFAKWESQFEQWKVQNANNPDQDYVRKHIEEMTAMRAKMLQRKENLRKQKSDNLQSKDMDLDSDNEEPFLLAQSTSKDSIPGLEEKKEEVEKEEGQKPLSAQDLANISKAVRSLEQPARDQEPPSKSQEPKPPQEKPAQPAVPAKEPVRPATESIRASEDHPPRKLARFGPQKKEGDWECQRCHKNNFAFRKQCKFCNLAKGADFQPRNHWPNNQGDNHVFEQRNQGWPQQNWSNDDEGSLFQRRDDMAFGGGDYGHYPANPLPAWMGAGTSSFDPKVVDYGHGSSSNNRKFFT